MRFSPDRRLIVLRRPAPGRRRLGAGLAVVLVAAGLGLVGNTPALADDYLARPASGVFSVQGHGEGHGRGMSQYGAQGAASLGLSSSDILNFYYPGTESTGIDPNTSIRVWISADTDNSTEVLYAADLVVRDDATGTTYALPGNTQRVRAIPSGNGFAVQLLIDGNWQDFNVAAAADAGAAAAAAAAPETAAADTAGPGVDADAAFPAAAEGPLAADLESGGAAFDPSAPTESTAPWAIPVPAESVTPTESTAPAESTEPADSTAPAPLRTAFALARTAAAVNVNGPVSFYAPSSGVVQLQVGGNVFGYRGTVSAVRSSGGSITVNQLAIEDYVKAVVPRESPSSWLPAALQSQAVAARSFSYVSVRKPNSSLYDICDTGFCQVYGGATLNGASRETSNTNNAADATRGLIRTYNGNVINAQFGSTNGGWTVDGGVPYLPAQADPYEAVANPPQSYANWKGVLTAASLESDFPQIGSFTRLRITARDGNGDWGGRVIAATVEGTAGTVETTGDKLRLAIDAPVRSRYFQIFDLDATNAPRGNLDQVSVAGSVLQLNGWTYDPDDPGAALAVHVYDTRPGGSVRATILTAGSPRADVGQAFPGVGNSHGLAATLPIAGRGNHQICVYAINSGLGNSNTTLGCRTVTVGTPFGAVDGYSAGPGPGDVTFNGWAIDPDSPATSTGIAAYVSNSAGTTGFGVYAAATPRGDVAAAFPGSGADHGYGVVVPLTATGPNTVCIYALAVNGGGPNTQLGCSRFDNVTAPIGNVDSLTAGAGTVSVSGWAFDPVGANRSVEVRFYVSGPAGTAGYGGTMADLSRTDVAAAIPGASADHGFSQTLSSQGSGPNQVCVWAIAGGTFQINKLLGCGSVQVG